METDIYKEYPGSLDQICVSILSRLSKELKEMGLPEISSFKGTFSYDSSSEKITVIAKIN
ncbi:hypothetical protein [Petroclostridium sp. X23]|jgi:hypothetical protein|uniref:hypothetical protein n=1 Tax=Petroclostridium sp. X23 TaxID=3045146 RepID=UPI0024ADA8B0|nr:hypothetical protein [Petroclostridium sp. X23]WHH61029.1 hypothetical protein QKW49_10110 [Petroclostridium sp. X23]